MRPCTFNILPPHANRCEGEFRSRSRLGTWTWALIESGGWCDDRRHADRRRITARENRGARLLRLRRTNVRADQLPLAAVTGYLHGLDRRRDGARVSRHLVGIGAFRCAGRTATGASL